ncbi:hypothetical protein JYU34_003758 [Plutella xylostella]|uniref:Uncharacterized protein n=1 Tax=Plutella xylostella TaxID=51655 RepID=A0ABQ7R0Y7_PLUXY|nr:hypothetical protein JYU34_003758 [Plutella xylostella]
MSARYTAPPAPAAMHPPLEGNYNISDQSIINAAVNMSARYTAPPAPAAMHPPLEGYYNVLYISSTGRSPTRASSTRP